MGRALERLPPHGRRPRARRALARPPPVEIDHALGDAGLRPAAFFFGAAVAFFGARAVRGAPAFGVFTVARVELFFAGAFFAFVFFVAIRVTSRSET